MKKNVNGRLMKLRHDATSSNDLPAAPKVFITLLRDNILVGASSPLLRSVVFTGGKRKHSNNNGGLQPATPRKGNARGTVITRMMIVILRYMAILNAAITMFLRNYIEMYKYR